MIEKRLSFFRLLGRFSIRPGAHTQQMQPARQDVGAGKPIPLLINVTNGSVAPAHHQKVDSTCQQKVNDATSPDSACPILRACIEEGVDDGDDDSDRHEVGEHVLNNDDGYVFEPLLGCKARRDHESDEDKNHWRVPVYRKAPCKSHVSSVDAKEDRD